MQISTPSPDRPHRTKPLLRRGQLPSPLTRSRQPAAADCPSHVDRRHAAVMSGRVGACWDRLAMAASAPKSDKAGWAWVPFPGGRLSLLFPSVNVSPAL